MTSDVVERYGFDPTTVGHRFCQWWVLNKYLVILSADARRKPTPIPEGANFIGRYRDWHDIRRWFYVFYPIGDYGWRDNVPV